MIATFMLLGVLLLNLHVRADASVADFLSQAKENWIRYRDLAGSFQGSRVVTIEEPPGGRITSKQSSVMRQLGPERTSEVTSGLDPDDTKEHAVVRNEFYLFELERRSANDPWSVKGFHQREPGAPPLSEEVAGDPRYAHSVKIPTTGLRLYNKSLVDLIDEPGFVLKAVENREPGIVRVTFEYEGALPNFPLKQGWVDLDRDHFFVIREYSSEAQWPEGPGTIRGACEYTIEPDGFPAITHATIVQQETAEGREARGMGYSIDFDLSRTIPVSKADFTLSAFGLPEPPGPQRKFLPTSVFFWTAALILVGVLSLLAASRLGRG